MYLHVINLIYRGAHKRTCMSGLSLPATCLPPATRSMYRVGVLESEYMYVSLDYLWYANLKSNIHVCLVLVHGP